MNYDIFFAGVGGQGILTIGEVLAEAAFHKGIPASFYPSKGMAQRGGFVKAQLRLGRGNIGPNIPQTSADMVVAMEPSESLKAVPYIRPGGMFVLYGDVWAPTAVSLGKAAYPELDVVRAQVSQAGARMLYLDPAGLPHHAGEPVRPNIYILGALLGATPLNQMFTHDEIESAIRARFKRGLEANLAAYQAGLRLPVETA